MVRFFPVLLTALLAGLFPGPALALPHSQGPVSDFSKVLSGPTRARLLQVIGHVEEKSTNVIKVVTVDSLDGMTVEEYGNKLFNEWKIGEKGKDNGILVLVCPLERKARIEVGYGLEGTVPDGLAGQVIRENMIPFFKKEDYSGGVQSAVERLALILTDKAPLPAPLEGYIPAPIPSDGRVGVAIFIILIALAGCYLAGMGHTNRIPGYILLGWLFGGFGLLSSILAFNLFSYPSLGVLLAGALGFDRGRRRVLKWAKEWLRKQKAGRGRSGSGGSGGRSGGGSSSGGSSGGGGASGGW